MTDGTHADEQSRVAADCPNERIVMPDAIKFSLPSVFKGDVPFLTFCVESNVVGKLWGTGGVLSFEGDVEESAKIFFDKVIELNKERLEA